MKTSMPLCLAAGALVVLPAPATAQITRDAPTPHVDLVVPRIGHVPQLRVQVEDRWHTLPAGEFRSRSGAAFTVKDGAIVAIEDPSSRTRKFSVVRVDAVALRIHYAPKLVFIDSRGRTAELPDGRYTGPTEASLDVRDGTIVGFRGGG